MVSLAQMRTACTESQPGDGVSLCSCHQGLPGETCLHPSLEQHRCLELPARGRHHFNNTFPQLAFWGCPLGVWCSVSTAKSAWPALVASTQALWSVLQVEAFSCQPLVFPQRAVSHSLKGPEPQSSSSGTAMQWVRGSEGPGLRPVLVGSGKEHCAAVTWGGLKQVTSLVSWSTASPAWSHVVSSRAVVVGPASLLQPHFPLNSSDLSFPAFPHPGCLRTPPACENYSFYRASQEALQVEHPSFTGN